MVQEETVHHGWQAGREGCVRSGGALAVTHHPWPMPPLGSLSAATRAISSGVQCPLDSGVVGCGWDV